MGRENIDIMPQLVKGGKYVFGWSFVSKDGRIIIPEEARQEYGIEPGERVILISGSKTSGGFSIARKSVIEQSRLSDILIRNPELAEFRTKEGDILKVNDRNICWITVRENGLFQLSHLTLKAYGIKPGDYLLVIRGSYIGTGMAAKGPLVEEAKKHHEIAVFLP